METKLSGENVIKQRTNTWAISLLRYSAAFLDWAKEELQQLHSRTRKLLTMPEGLHPKSITLTDCTYLGKKEEEDY